MTLDQMIANLQWTQHNATRCESCRTDWLSPLGGACATCGVLLTSNESFQYCYKCLPKAANAQKKRKAAAQQLAKLPKTLGVATTTASALRNGKVYQA